jgi:DtxR family Mn-dependent transcriptional regulator
MLNREDYILVIWEYLEAFERVQEKDISNRLNISPPTVHEYLLKLQQDGLINKDGRKIEFTIHGKSMAEKLIRMHRISEVFAYRFLEIPWEDVHASVMELEHIFTGEKGEVLFKNLGSPPTCPHGNPIEPTAKVRELLLPFVGDGKYYIRRISYEEINLLKTLSSAGALPDAQVSIFKTPDVIEVTAPNGTFELNYNIAMSIRLYK